MPYELKDADGKFQGPYEDEVIRSWVISNQIDANATIRDFQSGFESKASQLVTPVQGNFQAPAPTGGVVQILSEENKGFKDVMTATDGTAEFVGTIIFSIATLALCILVMFTAVPPIFTLITAIGAGAYAYRCYNEGHDQAGLAIGFVSVAGVLAIGVIIFMNMRSH